MSYPLVINEADIIEPQPINPTETFINVEHSTLDSVSMLDYWVWAFSDLVGNTERGVLAEYLVARAVRAKSPVRNSWAAYDIDSPDGTKIEVKSASYVQSWHQKKLSNIQFSIRKTLEWIPDKNEFGTEKKRQSDVYIFCLLNQKDKHKVDPLNLDQWEFYVIPTAVLDRELGDTQSISLARVKQYSANYTFKQLEQLYDQMGSNES